MNPRISKTAALAILALTVSVGGQAPAVGQDNSGVSPEMEQLIRQLGSPVFSERRDASQRLGQLGESAIAPLTAALTSASGEQRTRLEAVIRQLEAASFTGRFTTLKKTQAPSAAAKLPEWRRFEAIFGTSPQAIRLFTRLLTAETDLFRLADDDISSLRTPLQERAEELVDDKQQRKLTVDSVAAVLFLAANEKIILRGNTSTNVTDCMHGEFEKALNGPDAAALKKLAGRWILRQPISVVRPLKFARQYHLPEGLELARRTLRGPVRRGEAIPAMMLLREQGHEDDISIFESLFDPRHPQYNKTGGEGVMFRGRRLNDQYVCRNGDLALSLAISMRGGHPFEFGFRADRRNAPPAQFAFSEGTAGFISDAERTAALNAYRKAFNR